MTTKTLQEHWDDYSRVHVQGDFTASRDTHGQECPECSAVLIATVDYIGGGSHYWTLVCGKCLLRFTYDTYAFELRPYPLKTKP